MQATPATQSAVKNLDGDRQQKIDVWIIGSAVGFIVLAGMLGLLCWGADRGFDPVVEGFFMLSYQNPKLYPTFTSFHFFLNKVPPFIASEVVRYRVLDMVTHLGSALFLAFSFCRWCRGSQRFSRAQEIFVGTAACVGGLYGSAFFPRILSYNGLSSFFVLVSASFAFLALAPHKVAEQPEGGNRPWWLSALSQPALFLACGFFAGLDVFDKFSSGLGFMAVLAIFLIAQCRLRALPFVGLGVAIAAATYFGFFQTAPDWWRTLSEATELEGKTSHDLSTLNNESGALLKIYAMPAAILAFAVLVFTEFFKKFEPKAFRLLVSVTCLSLGVLAATACYLTYESCGIILALTAVSTALFYPIISDLKLGKMAPQSSKDGNAAAADDTLIGTRLLAGSLFLFLLPCSVSVGTNCDPLVHIGFTLAPWFMLVAIGCFFCQKRYAAPIASLLLACAVLIFTAIHFVHRGVFDRMDNGNLLKCDTPVSGIAPLQGIKLKPEAVKSYENAQRVLYSGGFVKGDPILCLYDLPGLVYAMQGTSPGQAWYVYWKERDGLNAHYLKQANLSDAARVFLVTTCKRCFHPDVLAALDEIGVPATAFEQLGKGPHPLTPRITLRFFVHRK